MGGKCYEIMGGKCYFYWTLHWKGPLYLLKSEINPVKCIILESNVWKCTNGLLCNIYSSRWNIWCISVIVY